MRFLTLHGVDDFVGRLKTEEPPAGSFVLLSPKGAVLLDAAKTPLLRLGITVSMEGREWLSGQTFSGLSPARLSGELAKRAHNIIPPPGRDDEAASRMQAIHRLDFADVEDLIIAAALARPVLFRIEIPVFENEPTYTIPMVLQPEADPQVFPAAWKAVFNAAHRDIAKRLRDGTGLPVLLVEFE